MASIIPIQSYDIDISTSAPINEIKRLRMVNDDLENQLEKLKGKTTKPKKK